MKKAANHATIEDVRKQFHIWRVTVGAKAETRCWYDFRLALLPAARREIPN